MSPRSAELLARAQEGLTSAELLLDGHHAETTVSTAYYAMLYAARAALSERNRYARTHKGIWDLFRREFVLTGRFDEALWKLARSAQERREASDYDAESFELAEAREIVANARRFVAAVERLTA